MHVDCCSHEFVSFQNNDDIINLETHVNMFEKNNSKYWLQRSH